jgi:hypothetical protein
VIPLRVSVFATIASLVVLVAVFELIRRRRLRERYAILWLGTAALMLVFSVWRGGLLTVAHAVGIYYPPSALFVLASLFVLVLLLHFSTVISRLTDETTTLAQRLALLEREVREPDEKSEEPRLEAVK